MVQDLFLKRRTAKDDFLAPRGGDELRGEDNYAGAFVIFSERGMDRNLFC